MNSLSHLKNQEIISKVNGLIGKQRESRSLLIRHLVEFDQRKLHLSLGYSGTFSYLVKKYKFSEGSAWRYTQALKVARQFPVVLDDLKEGRLSLTHLAKTAKQILSKEMTSTEKVKLLEGIKGLSSKEVEKVIAPKVKSLPKERVQTLVFEEQGEPKTSSKKKKITKTTKVYLKTLTFSVKESTYQKLERAKEILSGKYPKGALTSEIFEEALELLLEKKCPKRKQLRVKKRAGKKCNAKRKEAKAQKSHAPSRKAIPVKIKREVMARSNYQCSYVGEGGEKCDSTHNLHIDHVLPLALGGTDESYNLRVLCQQHNLYEARRLMGEGFVKKNFEKTSTEKVELL